MVWIKVINPWIPDFPLVACFCLVLKYFFLHTLPHCQSVQMFLYAHLSDENVLSKNGIFIEVLICNQTSFWGIRNHFGG